MDIKRLLELHEETCGEAFAIMRAKNHDYTSGSDDPFANFRASSFLGIHPIVGVCVRVVDKLQRIRTFAEQGTLQVKGESVSDACRDVINYMVLIQGIASESEESDDKQN
tara:strand:+ start:32242 stop:32571 length:330 start_codon:yes stop_codon:yes gene_type:complete